MTNGTTTTYTADATHTNINVTGLDTALIARNVIIDPGDPTGTTQVLTPVAATGSGALTFGTATNINGIALGSDVSTGGALTYNGPVTLASDAAVTTSGGNVTFELAVDGAHGLTVNAGGGTTTFNQAVGGNPALASVSINGAGGIALNAGSVTTNAGQVYTGPVTLGAPTTLSSTGSGSVNLASTVDGAQALTVNTAGITRFGGAVGSLGPALTNLTSDAPGVTALDAGAVTTTGAQTYNDSVTLGAELGAETNLSALNVTFGSAVDGARGLTVSASGTTTLGGPVGALTPLSSLRITNASGSTALNGGAVVTTAGQTYRNAVTLGTNTTLTDPGVSAQSTIGLGSNALTIAGGGTLAGIVSGSGGSLTKRGAGTLALSAPAPNSYTGGTRIDGGAVSFASGGIPAAGGLTIDGGTLRWDPSNSDDVSPVTIGNGGATFDTHGNDVTLAQPLTGSGSATKTGNGTLTLSAANTYSGSTQVQQGTLALSGSLVSHATLFSGATLNCTGGALNGGLTNNGGTATGAPNAPTGASATPGNGHATVSFTPGDPHCFPVIYTATTSPGGVHGTGSGSPVTVTPLIDGTTYTFTVTATSPVGSSLPSARSNAVKPLGPAPIARIFSPATGSRFNYQAFVPTTISCIDGGGGPGIAICTDSTHGNFVLDTSHPGTFKYSLIAVSEDGQSTIAQILYTVLFPNNKFNSPRVHPNRDGTTSFTLNLPWPGTVDVLETAAKSDLATAAALKPGKGQFAFASVHARIKKAGTARFRIRPSAAGRSLMKHHRHPVVIRLSITYTPAQGKPRTDTIGAIRLTR